MRRRVLKILKVTFLILLSLGALSLLFLCIERMRGKVSLARYKHELRTKHEAVTPSDLIKPRLEGANGAAEIILADHELMKGAVVPDHYPPRMKLTPSGRGVVGFRRPEWTESKVTYHWDQLALDLQTNRAILDRIRAGLGRPVLDYQLDYSEGPKMRFPHLIVAKSLTYWFGSECQLALHENRPGDSLEPLIAEMDLLRFLENDRIVISELVRIAIGAIARNDTWAALQADGWKDEQLMRIQKAWEGTRFLPNFTRSLEGERVFATTTFDLCRKSNAEAASILFWTLDFLDMSDTERPAWERTLNELTGGSAVTDFLKKQVYCRIWRFAWLDQCETRNLERVQRLVEISRAAEKSASLATTKTELDLLFAKSQNQNVYDELRFPVGLSSVASLSRAVGKAMRAETERSLAIAAFALKRYSHGNTNAPASLAILSPRFLDAVPIDYMDGKPIKFVVDPTGAVALYSVGEDGIDDHGDARMEGGKTSNNNPWARKDFVWPSAALPEEIETFEAEGK